MNSPYIKNITRILLILFGIFIFNLFAHAQSAINVLNVSIAPAYPGAHEEILVTLDNLSIDLNAAYISWVLNGKIVKQGIGIKTFTFKTGALGTVSYVEIIVNTATGEQLIRNFEIRPAEVDLIWEAFTYSPAFYKGKSLATSKSKVKISAIPHFILENGINISPDDLIYTWQQDRRVLGSLSGIGKRSVVIDAPQPFGETRVSVQISSPNDIYSAQKEVLINTRDPEIIFYEKHPTEGVRYNNALGTNITLEQEEMTVRAEPYFFSSEDFTAGRINFKWSLNNNNVPPSALINEITLRKDAGNGTAQLTLQIENFVKILQRASANLLINF